MLNKHLKIAIYSGEIPSTTFIERLIICVSKVNATIYLFGNRKKRTAYGPEVKVIGYTHNRLHKLWHLIKYGILLSLFQPTEKRQLDVLLKVTSKNNRYSKVKYYPVLWYKPDIFHLQWAKGLEEWSWVQEFGIKLILSLRGAHINYSPIADAKLAEMYRVHFPKVDGFHAVSKAIGKEAEKYGADVDKIKIIYSGLDLAEFKTFPKNQTLVFQILSIGRSHWIKGYTYALDACKILKDQGVQFHYTIVGGANDIELLYQIEDLGLQQEISLIGPTSMEEVKKHIQQSDLMLLPSINEGVANVVLEAMALKTLVLSTNCGGMNEVVVDSVNGYLTPIRDSKKMASNIKKIMSLPQTDKETIVSEAYHTIVNQHSEMQMVEGMLELYY